MSCLVDFPQLFSCSLIMFPSAFSVSTHSSVIFYLWSLPLYITYSCLLFFQQFPALYFGLRPYHVFNLCLIILNSNFLLTYRETFVHTARISRVLLFHHPTFLSSFCFSCHFLSSSLQPVILSVSSLRLSIPHCSPPAPPSSSLLSSCTVIQGGSRT